MAPSGLIGQIRRVTITEVSANSLFGALIPDQIARALQAAGA
jgi:hypothetical protein